MIIVILVCLIPHFIFQGVCISKPSRSTKYLAYMSVLIALQILLYSSYSPFNSEEGTYLRQFMDGTGSVLQILFFLPAFLVFTLAPMFYIVQIARYRSQHPRYVVHLIWSICLILLLLNSEVTMPSTS